MKRDQLKTLFRNYGTEFAINFLKIHDYLKSEGIQSVELTCSYDYREDYCRDIDPEGWVAFFILEDGGDWEDLDKFNPSHLRDVFKKYFLYWVNTYSGGYPLAALEISLRYDYDHYVFEVMYREVHTNTKAYSLY